VFVDEVVVGDLPPVCAKTGAAATGRMVSESSVGTGAGWAWLLIFLGPIGWIALLLVATRGQETLQGEIPMSGAASRVIFDRLRLRNICALGAVVFAIGAWFVGGRVSGAAGPLLLMALSALLVGLGFHIAADLAGVDMELDGSRRWVTLRRVHPDFIAAVEERRQRHTVRD
jgi:hypothetical protein